MAEYSGNYGYKRGRDKLSRLLNRAESLADDIFEGGATSDRARRLLFENGIRGRAHVLKAPSKYGVSEIQENVGTFNARIELQGRERAIPDRQIETSVGLADPPLEET